MKVEKVGNEYFYTVSWEARKDGVMPRNTIYNGNILKDICPQLIIEFYEGK